MKWPHLRRPCHDRKCRRLARLPLVFGVVCIGEMETPTDHVAEGVNDLRLCVKQGAVTEEWHCNRRDLGLLAKTLDRVRRKLNKEARCHT